MLKPTNLADFAKSTSGEGVTFVYFTATWCGPCKKVSPTFEALKGVTLVKVDADEGGDILDNYGIQSVPTLQIWRRGEKLETIEGVRAKQLTDKLQEYTA